MTDAEIRLLLLTLTPDEVLNAYIPDSVAEIARAAFAEDQREKAVWACAGLLSPNAMRNTPEQYDRRRYMLMSSWALRGLLANPAYQHVHSALQYCVDTTPKEVVYVCNRDGYSGIARTFAALADSKSHITARDYKLFVSEALLFYRQEKRDEAATTLLRDLCRLFYD
jgi:hypothetical protein